MGHAVPHIKGGMIMMYMPSLFDGRFFDEWMSGLDTPFFSSLRNPESGAHKPLMKTDIKENSDRYELAIDLPGYRKEDLRAELKDGYLLVSAEQKKESEEKSENGRYLRRERYTGALQRSFYVGRNVKQEDICAKFENGILTLTLLKKKEEEAELPSQNLIAIEG